MNRILLIKDKKLIGLAKEISMSQSRHPAPIYAMGPEDIYLEKRSGVCGSMILDKKVCDFIKENDIFDIYITDSFTFKYRLNDVEILNISKPDSEMQLTFIAKNMFERKHNSITIYGDTKEQENINISWYD